MSAVTLVVVGLSMRTGASGQPHTAAAPAGVVRPQVDTSPAVRTPTPKATHTAAPVTTTVNGQPADTRFGPVQVQVQVRAGRIVKADAVDYPQGSGRDQEINSFAIPQLDQETLSAQTAQVDTVSGATYTSDGYRQSLQSALDAAHQAGAL
jgi:uncharacterized protein with FMN-binding domain